MGSIEKAIMSLGLKNIQEKALEARGKAKRRNPRFYKEEQKVQTPADAILLGFDWALDGRNMKLWDKIHKGIKKRQPLGIYQGKPDRKTKLMANDKHA